MQKNDLIRSCETILRILAVRDDKVLVLDCLKRNMPQWVDITSVYGLESCTELDLTDETNMELVDLELLALLTSKTVHDELPTQWKKPVLIMTTQRYFALSREDIIEFTKWGRGCRRDTIIFDEKPFLIERRHIGIYEFNIIDTALHEAIDDTVDSDEKAWITTQWKLLIERMKQVIVDYESKTDIQLEQWHYTPDSTLTEDDSRFFAFIEKYRKKLNQYRNGVCVDIYAIRQL